MIVKLKAGSPPLPATGGIMNALSINFRLLILKRARKSFDFLSCLSCLQTPIDIITCQFKSCNDINHIGGLLCLQTPMPSRKHKPFGKQ